RRRRCFLAAPGAAEWGGRLLGECQRAGHRGEPGRAGGTPGPGWLLDRRDEAIRLRQRRVREPLLEDRLELAAPEEVVDPQVQELVQVLVVRPRGEPGGERLARAGVVHRLDR